MNDLVFAASNEIWGYLADLPVANAKKPGVPYRWMRRSSDQMTITFGSSSYSTDQVCYRILIDESNVTMLTCQIKSGDTEELDREEVYIGNPNLFDMVQAFVSKITAVMPR